MNKYALALCLATLPTIVLGHGLETHETTRAATDVKSNYAPDTGGSWSPTEHWPVLAVHATVLPTGDVFAWDATPDDFDVGFGTEITEYHDDQRNTTRVTVWNPETNEHKSTFNPEGTGDLFCAGSVHLTDGRIIFAGGDSGVSGKNGPSANSNIYDPWTNQWTSTDNMNSARWYASLTTLSNGETLALGGSYNPSPDAEIFGFNKQWTKFESEVHTSEILSGDYPWLTTASDGSVVYVGPHNRIDTIYTDDLFQHDAWQEGPRRDAVELAGRLGSYRGYGSYAMFGEDKILISGGGSSSPSSVIVDINSKTVETTAPMTYGRRQHNLTILADGSVLATGGNSSGTDLYDKNAPVLTPELWNPDTGTWTSMNDMKTDRQYHSVALLLPDARVLLAGSGYCIPCFQQDHEEQNAEIFSPPYLFKGERPVIVNAPEKANYNQDITIDIENGITNAHLIKLSSVTHSQSQDQRLVKLTLTNSTDTSATLRMPENRFLAPPGHYMLFVVNNGVPSKATIVRLGQPLLQNNDVMINPLRANKWEYFEIHGNDEHTLTVNLQADLENTELKISGNGNRPYDGSNSGFESCTIASGNVRQCTISSMNDTIWYIGVKGLVDGEMSLSVNLDVGISHQSTNNIATPENVFVLPMLSTDDYSSNGNYIMRWNEVADAVRYEIYKDGRLTKSVAENSYTIKNLGAIRTHNFQVLAVGQLETRSALSTSVEIITSTEPYVLDPTTKYNPVIPSIPVRLRMYKANNGDLTLLWERSFDDIGIAGYEVYRNGDLIANLTTSGVSLPQEDLRFGDTYIYEVVAYDRDGNRSARSQPLRVTINENLSNSDPIPNLASTDFNPVNINPVNNITIESTIEPIEVNEPQVQAPITVIAPVVQEPEIVVEVMEDTIVNDVAPEDITVAVNAPSSNSSGSSSFFGSLDLLFMFLLSLVLVQRLKY